MQHSPPRKFPPIKLFSALLILLLSGLTSTTFADPGVKDDGQFFKPETVEKANTEIKQIKADYGKELVVETFLAIPEGLKDEWEAAKDDRQKRSDFFGKWIGERAHKLQVNGVYILICQDPTQLEVKAGLKTKQKAFTETNQNKLRDILLETFKAKNDDEGLLKGISYFREALKANLGGAHSGTPAATSDEQFRHPNSGNSSGSALPTRNQSTRVPTTPAASTFKWSPIMTVILVVIAAIVIFRILAGLTGGSRNSGGGNYGQGQQGGGPGYGAGYGGGGNNYGGGGGGGFMRNMFGGLLGGAAGGYLYDKFRDSNNPAQNQQNSNVNNVSDNPSGGDFSSPSSSNDDNDRGQGFGGGGSGGDFGSSSSDSGSSSGGDFGSSSSSDSGSSGGGDSGGGGGDF